MRKYNRMRKKRSSQADKLSKYLMNVVTGKTDDTKEVEGQQFKELMESLGLVDQSINYDEILKNPQ